MSNLPDSLTLLMVPVWNVCARAHVCEYGAIAAVNASYPERKSVLSPF